MTFVKREKESMEEVQGIFVLPRIFSFLTRSGSREGGNIFEERER
jgi:hypothetical protein